jgi:OmpA-OmpF porin, OOP family
MSQGTLNYNTGWELGGSGGYSFDSGFRVEGEVTYRDSNISGLSDNPGAGDIGGNASSWAFMANGYYDIPTHSRWTPYIGGGIGLALDHLEVDVPPPGPATVVDGTSTEFAYQGIAGIGYQITEALNLALEYQYFATLNPTYDLNIPGGPPGLDLNTGYGSSNVLLKLSWKLN